MEYRKFSLVRSIIRTTRVRWTSGWKMVDDVSDTCDFEHDHKRRLLTYQSLQLQLYFEWVLRSLHLGLHDHRSHAPVLVTGIGTNDQLVGKNYDIPPCLLRSEKGRIKANDQIEVLHT